MKIFDKGISCTSFAPANESAVLQEFERAGANYISLNLQFARAKKIIEISTPWIEPPCL